MTAPSRRIEDYAMVGDCRSAALVSLTGSVDWLCFPRFDSGAVFAALLGSDTNGRWRLAPADPDAVPTRRYRPGTLVLETDWRTADGTARVTDFMDVTDGRANLIRIVAGLAGSVAFDLDLVLRLDYGRSVPWVRRLDDGALTAVSGPSMMVFRSPVPVANADMRTTARFAVEAEESVAFDLSHQDSWLSPRPAVDVAGALETTEAFWRGVSDAVPDAGPWTELVRRSLITLKALVYRPTGGIVAAPTTSLPETIGGGRNWDYRYCWLRDSSLTLMAFLELGFTEEASAWRDWLLRAIAGDPAQMQIMYGVAGERQLPEWEADWLPGFRDSAPVRIGNAAAGQFQLDVYGEVSQMLTLATRGGLAPHPEAQGIVATLLPFLEKNWHQPDDGIWEMRGERRHFVHSKVMAWVAFDCAARLADDRDDVAERDRWRGVADAIHADVCAKGFDADLGSFVQSYGSGSVDASLLHIVLTGFLPPDDPRAVGTVAAIEARLSRDGFVARYDTGAAGDGVSDGQEGTFLICTFWLIDALVLTGRRAEAMALFEKTVALANDVGLLAEEYDPEAGHMLGNFPQAFSHVGLILSALNLSRTDPPAGKRADCDGATVAADPERRKED